MIRSLLLALLTPALASAQTPPPKPPSRLGSELVVVLAEKEPVRLVAWVGPRGNVLDRGLDGALEVRLENGSDAPLAIADLGVHGLLFTGRKSGETHVVVHACKCARDATEPNRSRLELPAGARHAFVLDEWGCGGGSFRAPPPGDYEVRYRLLPHPLPPFTRGPAPTGAPKLARACREALARPAWWSGAAVSAPIRVRLAKPVRLPVEE